MEGPQTNQDLAEYYRELSQLKEATKRAAERMRQLSPQEQQRFVALIEEKTGSDAGKWFQEMGIDPAQVPGTKAYQEGQSQLDLSRVPGTPAYHQTGEFQQLDPAQVIGTQAQRQTSEVAAIDPSEVPGTSQHTQNKWKFPWSRKDDQPQTPRVSAQEQPDDTQ